MYPNWEHWRDLKGTCTVCGKPSHVGASMRPVDITGFMTITTCESITANMANIPVSLKSVSMCFRR